MKILSSIVKIECSGDGLRDILPNSEVKIRMLQGGLGAKGKRYALK